ncbi:MAG: hypothetical protein ABIZ72_07020 [Candidatus Limnocylindrales bacterium]
MSKTKTSREPRPNELEHASADQGLDHPGDLPDESHGRDDHGETPGHDDHARGGEALGPVDVQAWGALAIGLAAGLLIALCLVITTSLLAPAAI